MKKYLKILVLTLMFATFSGIALSETVTVRSEVLQENNVTSNVEKANRLDSKKMKDKADSGITKNGTGNKKMIQYKQFNDGEGALKNKQ